MPGVFVYIYLFQFVEPGAQLMNEERKKIGIARGLGVKGLLQYINTRRNLFKSRSEPRGSSFLEYIALISKILNFCILGFLLLVVHV